jgi:hypothetical protein
MLSTGILSRIKNKYAAKEQQTNTVPTYEVRFEAVIPLVGFMAMGIFLSTASLFIELGVRRFRQKRSGDRKQSLRSLSIVKLSEFRVH